MKKKLSHKRAFATLPYENNICTSYSFWIMFNRINLSMNKILFLNGISTTRYYPHIKNAEQFSEEHFSQKQVFQ